MRNNQELHKKTSCLETGGCAPSAEHLYPDSQLLLSDCSQELRLPLFVLLFLSWDLITLDSLLGHDRFLTHHNALPFKAVSETHFLPPLTLAVGDAVPWNTSTHGHCSTWGVPCSSETHTCPKTDISGILLVKNQANDAQRPLFWTHDITNGS